MAFSKITALAALVSFAALSGAMSEAAAQGIITFKHYPSQTEAIEREAFCNRVADADPRCVWKSDTAISGYQDTGFGITFRKLRDDTGLRCSFAGDFVAAADSLIAQLLVIDDGKSWGIAKGLLAPSGTWTADFWGFTFIDVPAGDHRIGLSVYNLSAAETLLYTKYAMLQCFEETLGVRQ